MCNYSSNAGAEVYQAGLIPNIRDAVIVAENGHIELDFEKVHPVKVLPKLVSAVATEKQCEKAIKQDDNDYISRCHFKLSFSFFVVSSMSIKYIYMYSSRIFKINMPISDVCGSCSLLLFLFIKGGIAVFAIYISCQMVLSNFKLSLMSIIVHIVSHISCKNNFFIWSIPVLVKTTVFYEKIEKTRFFGLNRFLWFKPVFMVFIIFQGFCNFKSN